MVSNRADRNVCEISVHLWGAFESSIILLPININNGNNRAIFLQDTELKAARFLAMFLLFVFKNTLFHVAVFKKKVRHERR